MGFFTKFDAKKQAQDELKTSSKDLSDEVIEMIFKEIGDLRKIVESKKAELKLTTELVGKLSLEIKELQKQNGKRNEN